MNRIRPCYNSGAQNLFHCQIAICRTRRSNADSLIRQLCMQCIPVCFGVHSNRLNFHLPTRPDDPNRNFTSVCNKYLSDHVCYQAPIINVSSALATIFPPTLAVASPIPIGPFFRIMRVSRQSLSPGITFPLKRHLSTAPKYAILPDIFRRSL